jgi:hypothetical protein
LNFFFGFSAFSDWTIIGLLKKKTIMRAKRSIQEEKKRKRMEEEGSGGGQEVKQKIKKPRISRVERKRRREEKEELARQVRFAKQQEKIAAQIRKKQEYDLKLQEIRYNEFLFEVEPGTFGLPSMDDDKPTRYRDRRKVGLFGLLTCLLYVICV